MPSPICRAQSQVKPQELLRVESEAKESFTESRAVLDAELLNQQEWKSRQQTIQKTLGLAASLEASEMVRRLMDRMDTREMPFYRTHTNLLRLIKSRRLSDAQVADWVGLALKDGELDRFRDKSKQILLGAKLFFYEFIPHQGTAWCYMPTKN